jgi:hypothetical protein
LEWKEPSFQNLPRLNLVSLQNGHSVFYSSLELPKQLLIILRQIGESIWQKIYFIWMVLALPILYFDTCSIMELGFLLCWGLARIDLSSTVVMKIDLVGEKDRGLAMGLNEFAGYFAVGLVAFSYQDILPKNTGFYPSIWDWNSIIGFY